MKLTAYSCICWLFHRIELSHFDVTDFIALNWLYFYLGSVFAFCNNVKVHYVGGFFEEPDVSLEVGTL